MTNLGSELQEQRLFCRPWQDCMPRSTQQSQLQQWQHQWLCLAPALGTPLSNPVGPMLFFANREWHCWYSRRIPSESALPWASEQSMYSWEQSMYFLVTPTSFASWFLDLSTEQIRSCNMNEHGRILHLPGDVSDWMKMASQAARIGSEFLQSLIQMIDW